MFGLIKATLAVVHLLVQFTWTPKTLVNTKQTDPDPWSGGSGLASKWINQTVCDLFFCCVGPSRMPFYSWNWIKITDHKCTMYLSGTSLTNKITAGAFCVCLAERRHYPWANRVHIHCCIVMHHSDLQRCSYRDSSGVYRKVNVHQQNDADRMMNGL